MLTELYEIGFLEVRRAAALKLVRILEFQPQNRRI